LGEPGLCTIRGICARFAGSVGSSPKRCRLCTGSVLGALVDTHGDVLGLGRARRLMQWLIKSPDHPDSDELRTVRTQGSAATAGSRELFDLMVDEVHAEILPEEQPGEWREALRVRAHRTRQAALRHEWLADLLGGRLGLGPNALAVAESTLAALAGRADLDTGLRAVETVSAYVTGAIRHEIANRRAERATGLSKRDWQHANGPHLTRMLDTGRFPALAKAVYDGTDVDAEVSFTTGLDRVLDAIAAKLGPERNRLPGPGPRW
jgi:hypothetical protein